MSTPPSASRATELAPLLKRARVEFVVQAGLTGSALAIYLLVLTQAGVSHQDFGTYLTAARDLWHGQPLYAAFLGHPFPDPTLRPAYIYPPVFALLLAPLALLPDQLASVIWLLIGQASLAAALGVIFWWRRPTGWAAVALLGATFTFYPLWVDVVQGQANLLILLLVLAGIAGITKGEPRFGAALGVAAALKLTPLLLLPWLVLDRRFREAAWMVGTAAAVTAVAALVRFQDSIAFISQVAPALGRGTAFYANQSLAGILARSFHTNPYTDAWISLPWAGLLPPALALGVLAGWFWRTRGQPAAIRAVAFVPLLPLLSPVTWPHHLVIVLPVIWISAIALAHRNWPLLPTLALAGILALYSLVSRWPVGPAFGDDGFKAAQTGDPIVFLFANAIFFATLLLFFSAPWLLRSH